MCGKEMALANTCAYCGVDVDIDIDYYDNNATRVTCTLHELNWSHRMWLDRNEHQCKTNDWMANNNHNINGVCFEWKSKSTCCCVCAPLFIHDFSQLHTQDTPLWLYFAYMT